MVRVWPNPFSMLGIGFLVFCSVEAGETGDSLPSDDEVLSAFERLMVSNRFPCDPSEDDMAALDAVRRRPGPILERVLGRISLGRGKDISREIEVLRVLAPSVRENVIMKAVRTYPVGHPKSVVGWLSGFTSEEAVSRMRAEILADPNGGGVSLSRNIVERDNRPGIEMLSEIFDSDPSAVWCRQPFVREAVEALRRGPKAGDPSKPGGPTGEPEKRETRPGASGNTSRHNDGDSPSQDEGSIATGFGSIALVGAATVCLVSVLLLLHLRRRHKAICRRGP
jgi:hypothetical protein